MANVDYVNYDYDDLVGQLQNQLRTKTTWTDLYASSTGETLIELMAYVNSICLFYIERSAQEMYLPTAQNYSSVVNLVKLLNYDAKRTVSATGLVTFDNTHASCTDLSIPTWTELIGGDNKYLVTNGFTITAGETVSNVTCVQGELKTINLLGSDIASNEYTITDSTCEADTHKDTQSFSTILVSVNGVQWNNVSSFYASTATDLHYTVDTNVDGNANITFGDGISGTKVQLTDVIIIRYVSSIGAAGDAGALTLEFSTLDSEHIVITTTGFVGGDAPEDITEIKYEAPRVFKTGNRAVTREDFISLIRNFGGIADANVWGEYEELDGSSTSAQTITDTVASYSGTTLTLTTGSAALQAAVDYKPRIITNNTDALSYVLTSSSSPTVYTVAGTFDATDNVSVSLEGASNFSMINKVRICLLTGSETSDWKSQHAGEMPILINNYLQKKSILTCKYDYVPAYIYQIEANLNITAGSQYSLSDVEDVVSDALMAQFVLGQTAELGSEIYGSVLYEDVNALPQVNHHTLKLVATKPVVGETDMTLTPNLERANVKVYAGDTLVATDDGGGTNWSYESGYDATKWAGTINYTTGALDITKNDADGAGVGIAALVTSISFSAVGNDFVADRDEIFQLTPENINTSISYAS